VLVLERIECGVVGIARELPAVLDLVALAVAVFNDDVTERTPGNRVVVGNDPLLFRMEPRSEYLLVTEASVRIVG
jgi:hypothetical protein